MKYKMVLVDFLSNTFRNLALSRKFGTIYCYAIFIPLVLMIDFSFEMRCDEGIDTTASAFPETTNLGYSSLESI